MLNNAPEVVVTENIDFAPVGNWLKAVQGSHYLSGVKGKIKILRHLSADTFDIYFEHLDSSHTLYPYLNIAANNKKPQTFQISHVLNNAPKNNGFMRIHRSEFGDMKFSDISKMTLGYSNVIDVEPTSGNSVSRITTLPFLHKIQKTIAANFNSVIHLKTIKSITIEKTTPYTTSVSSDDNKYETVIRYNNIYVVPTQPKRVGGNKVLFNVYMNNDLDEDFKAHPTTVGDNRIVSKKMKSTSFGATGVETEVFTDTSGKYQTIEKTIKTGGTVKIVKSAEVPQVARVELTRRSHYDFDKKKTVLGNSWDSVDGEIIPYSLKGNYSRKLEISFNNSFKGTELDFATRFDKPYLDASEGEIQLKIKNDFKPSEVMNGIFKSKMHKLNTEKIRQIKNNDFSLIGLERL